MPTLAIPEVNAQQQRDLTAPKAAPPSLERGAIAGPSHLIDSARDGGAVALTLASERTDTIQASPRNVPNRSTGPSTLMGSALGASVEDSRPTLGTAAAVERNTDRQTEMMREAERLARVHANQNFEADPAKGPDSARVQAELRRLADRYQDVVTPENRERLQKELVSRYQQSYETLHTQRFENELNWAQRRYYGAQEWVAKAWNALPDMGSLWNDVKSVAKATGTIAAAVVEGTIEVVTPVVKAAVAKLTDPDTYSDLWDSTVSAAKTVASGAKALAIGIGTGIRDGAVWLSKPENLAKIGTAIADGVSTAWEVVTSKETWIKIGNGIKAGLTIAGEAIVKGGEALASIGSALLKVPGQACSDFIKVMRGELSLGDMMRNLDKNIIAAGQEAWAVTKAVAHGVATAARAAGHLLYAIGESTGINSILRGAREFFYELPKAMVMGVVNTATGLVTDALRLARGEITAEELKENFKRNVVESARAVGSSLVKSGELIVGGLNLVGEITGIKDAALTVYHAARGEWGLAALHGGLALASFGSIAATIGTAGAAAPTLLAVAAGRMALKEGLKQVGKQALKTIAKEGFEALAKEASEKVVSRIATKLTPEVLARAGERAAQATIKGLDSTIAREGLKSATRETAYELASKATAEAAEKLMKQAKVTKIVAEEASDLLTRCAKGSKANITRELRELGIAKSDAKSMAREIRSSLRSGRHLDEYREVLESKITASVRQHLDDGMKPSFTRKLNEGLGELQAKHGLPQTTVREMREGASKGFDDALESTVKRHVEAGVQKAIKELEESLKKRIRLHLGGEAHDADIETRAVELSPAKPDQAIKHRGIENAEFRDPEMMKKKPEDGAALTFELAPSAERPHHHEEIPGGAILGRIGPQGAQSLRRAA